MKTQKRKPPFAMCNVRISQEAKDKLESISQQKSCSQGSAASNIIMHYAANNLDYEIAFSNVQKTIVQKLDNLSFYTSKIVGSTERTEAFIKSLIHDDRPRFSLAPAELPEEGEGAIATLPGQEKSLVDALSSLRQFIESARPTSTFDGQAVMQIKIPTLEFNKLKSEYERLCMSLNM